MLQAHKSNFDEISLKLDLCAAGHTDSPNSKSLEPLDVGFVDASILVIGAHITRNRRNVERRARRCFGGDAAVTGSNSLPVKDTAKGSRKRAPFIGRIQCLV